jgi:hypothetical protein
MVRLAVITKTPATRELTAKKAPLSYHNKSCGKNIFELSPKERIDARGKHDEFPIYCDSSNHCNAKFGMLGSNVIRRFLG